MGRRPAQQMGQIPLRLLGVFSTPVEEVAEEVEEAVMMKAMRKERGVMEQVVVQLAGEQEEEATEAEEEAVEAEGAPLGETLANPQTMARTQTQSQIQPAVTHADGGWPSGSHRGRKAGSH